MKKAVLLLSLIYGLRSYGQDAEGVKPGISINGAPCLIQNLTFSCTPKTCDSIVIMAGDSIEFCTYQQIFLNTDTAFWMRWHFYGADNLPDTILNPYPSQTPICYWPRWDSAGTYIAEAFYNGVLSAYPTSDCYQQGPSHWYMKVVVLPIPNGINEPGNENAIQVFPNPSHGIFSVTTGGADRLISVCITDISGREVLTTSENTFDLSESGAGIYFATVTTEHMTVSLPLVLPE